MRFFSKAVVAALLLALATWTSAAITEQSFDPSTLLKLQGGLKVYNTTGGTIAKGALVYVSSWTESNITRWRITKADADAGGAASFAQAIMRDACYTSTVCDAYSTFTLYDQNTNGLAVGDPIYLSATAGGWTSTAPTTSNAVQQLVGRVRKVSSTVGVIEFDLRHAPVIKIGTGQLQTAALTLTGISTTCRAAATVAAGDLMYISSYNASDAVQVCAIADADVANGYATWVAGGAITSGTVGTVYKSLTATMDTSLGSVGAAVYLTVTGTTTNTLSLTPPTGSDDVIQIVGRVTVVNASGSVLIDLTANKPGNASNDYQAASVDAAAIGADAVQASELGVTAGTATASRAAVVDANKDFTGIRNLTLGAAAVAGSLVVNDGSTNTVTTTYSDLKNIDDVTNGTVEGTTATAVEKISGMHRSVFTLAVSGANLVTIADGDHGGGKKFYNFPEGEIIIYGAVLNGTVTNTAAFNADTNDQFFFAIGTGCAADDNDLTSTEANVIAKTTIDTASGVTLTRAEGIIGLTTPIYLDGTTTPITLCANFAIPATQNSGSNDVGVTGTLTVLWSNAGDK